MTSIVWLDEILNSHDINPVEDRETERLEDRSVSEVVFKPEMEQSLEQELTDLRVLECLHDLPVDPQETVLTIHKVDQYSIKSINRDNTESNWVAPDGL